MHQTIIHIGFPKTGTTYLQKYFDLHPDIYHNRDRFNGYYKTGKINQDVLMDASNRKFDVLSEELLSIWQGDASGENFQKHHINYDIQKQQKQVAVDLKELFPDAKILITVRNYSSLLGSLYSQYLFGGGTGAIDFFLKDAQPVILRLFNYDYLIQTYRDLFGVENVIVVPFEFLSEDTVEYLTYLEDVLGFPHQSFAAGKIHYSLKRRGIRIVRCLNFITLSYLKCIPKKRQKATFLKYTEWLYRTKESNKKIFGSGKKLIIPDAKIQWADFKKNTELISFKGILSKYNHFYH